MWLFTALPLALAAAVALCSEHALSERQDWTSSFWSQEFTTYGCRPVIFVFARATIEPGNMVGVERRGCLVRM